MDAVHRVLDAGPHVFNHNMETVAALYGRVRPQADYRQSLAVLAEAKRYRPAVLTKSGLMAGLGETPAQVEELLGDLLRSGADFVTIGQYLQPTRRNLPVAEYVAPRQFDEYRRYGMALGLIQARRRMRGVAATSGAGGGAASLVAELPAAGPTGSGCRSWKVTR